jgi:hypothetical protein
VWNHGVPPSHGVIQGALYPVFGGRELAADWRYTTNSMSINDIEHSTENLHEWFSDPQYTFGTIMQPYTLQIAG